MADDQTTDDSQKTEDPTPKKLEEARKRGQVALSREVNNWVMICAGTILIMSLSGTMCYQLKDAMVIYIEQAHALPPIPDGIGIVLGGAVKKVALIMLLPFLLLLIAAFVGPFLQVGPLFAPEVIKPNINKISIFTGFSRLFSLRSLVEFAKGLLKLAIVGTVAFIIIYPYFDKFEHMIDMPFIAVMIELKFLVVRMLVGILILATSRRRPA